MLTLCHFSSMFHQAMPLDLRPETRPDPVLFSSLDILQNHLEC